MEDTIGGPGMHTIISNAVKNVWLKANPIQVERYTIPLYDGPDPELLAALEAIEAITRDGLGVTAIDSNRIAYYAIAKARGQS